MRCQRMMQSRMDSPSIFGAILGRRAGTFRVSPSDVSVPAARRYLPGTMILETSWGTDTGWIIVRDVLLLGPWRHDTALSRTQRRTPTDYEAEHTLLRTILNTAVLWALHSAGLYYLYAVAIATELAIISNFIALTIYQSRLQLRRPIAVERPVTRPPLHRSRRAVFPHRALQGGSLRTDTTLQEGGLVPSLHDAGKRDG